MNDMSVTVVSQQDLTHEGFSHRTSGIIALIEVMNYAANWQPTEDAFQLLLGNLSMKNEATVRIVATKRARISDTHSYLLRFSVRADSASSAVLAEYTERIRFILEGPRSLLEYSSLPYNSLGNALPD